MSSANPVLGLHVSHAFAESLGLTSASWSCICVYRCFHEESKAVEVRSPEYRESNEIERTGHYTHMKNRPWRYSATLQTVPFFLILKIVHRHIHICPVLVIHKKGAENLNC